MLRSVLFSVLLLLCVHARTQEKEDPGKEFVSLRYYNIDNRLQYLVLSSQLKKNNQLKPQHNKEYEVYLDNFDPAMLIGKLKTDIRGNANAVIPPSLKTVWDAQPQHTFVVMQGEEEIISDYSIVKSRIVMDTSTVDSVRMITVQVSMLNDEQWEPVPDVEMKVGVKRIGGILSAGDDETYTTDSSGSVTVAMTRTDIPGDLKGCYVLTAKIEDHDMLGNVVAEKQVPWGNILAEDNRFFTIRSLWSTRSHAPYWLLFMAYGIVISVWATLAYLVVLLFRIRKLGNAELS